MEKQKFQFESEEQLRNFLDNCIVTDHCDCNVEATIIASKKLGYIRKSELQTLVEEAKESIEYLREQSREVKLDQCIDRIEELIQALKKDHPEYKYEI
jgi:hypothetical protein